MSEHNFFDVIARTPIEVLRLRAEAMPTMEIRGIENSTYWIDGRQVTVAEFDEWNIAIGKMLTEPSK